MNVPLRSFTPIIAQPAPFTKQIRTLFDTTEDGHPSEAVLFGDDMKAVSYVTRCGQSRIVLNGPDGEIDLTAAEWAAVSKMFAGVR